MQGALPPRSINSTIMPRDEVGRSPAPDDERRLLSEHASQEAILDALPPLQAAAYVKDRDGLGLSSDVTGVAKQEGGDRAKLFAEGD
jgi:hypothetical protein